MKKRVETLRCNKENWFDQDVLITKDRAGFIKLLKQREEYNQRSERNLILFQRETTAKDRQENLIDLLALCIEEGKSLVREQVILKNKLKLIYFIKNN